MLLGCFVLFCALYDCVGGFVVHILGTGILLDYIRGASENGLVWIRRFLK